MPIGIRQAVIAIWATLAIDALLALYEKMTGHATDGEFASTIIFYSLLCILPYKISNASNAARYVYLIITIGSVLIMLGGVGYEKMKLEYFVSIFLIPVEAFILYRLFQKGTSDWFKKVQ
ncbi:hypothetical protein ACFQ1T_11720 [Methylophilus glucosoxydans]|uniref:Uncharacterized protein n=1 Tax=Methylophilus glucosoxydans TaxID=752553 RepID=A0ABW3GK99_9PROT